jgi:hypothetical protein
MASQPSSSQPQASNARLQQQGYAIDAGESPGATQPSDQTPLSQMSALDRFGLPGLLATVRSENPDVASLAIGQDLTQLGLNLNSPESVRSKYPRVHQLFSLTKNFLVDHYILLSLGLLPNRGLDPCNLTFVCLNAIRSITCIKCNKRFPGSRMRPCFGSFTRSPETSCRRWPLLNC